MTLLGLAGIIAISVVGPLLATPRRLGFPVVVGELAVGVVIGTSGFRWVHPGDRVLTFLAQAGFALVMLIAGSHVPVAHSAMRVALGRGLALAVGVGVLAIPVAAALSDFAHTHHTALYAVLIASSSAAVVMPMLGGESAGSDSANGASAGGDKVLTLIAQVAIADTACIVALPLAADPSRAGRAAVGSIIVLAVAGLTFLVLRELAERGFIAKLHATSVRRTFGLEMRLSLAALFALAGLATSVHVSVMLAGFAFGLVLSGLGTPRRLASQLFAVTEGFLGPIFFIWLGASIDLRALAHHPRLLILAAGLAIATTVLHALGRLLGQPLPLAVLASAQLGVPVAAVALGSKSGLLAAGEGAAILAAALITLAIAALAARSVNRSAQALTAQATTVLAPKTRLHDPDRSADRPASATSEAVSAPPRKATTEQPPAPPSRPVPAPTPSPAPPAKTSRLTKPTPTKPPQRTVAAPTNVTAKASPRSAGTTAAAVRPPTPNPATKPIVQSNVRIQPPPRRESADSGRDSVSSGRDTVSNARDSVSNARDSVSKNAEGTSDDE